MLFFELFSLNLSRLFHCSVIKVLCPAVLRDNFYILSQLSAFVNRFFHKKNNFNIGKCKFGEVLKLAEEVPLLRV